MQTLNTNTNIKTENTNIKSRNGICINSEGKQILTLKWKIQMLNLKMEFVSILKTNSGRGP